MNISIREYSTIIDYDTSKLKAVNECNCEENCGCLTGGSCLCHEGRCRCHEKCKCETVKVKCVNTTL